MMVAVRTKVGPPSPLTLREAARLDVLESDREEDDEDSGDVNGDNAGGVDASATGTEVGPAGEGGGMGATLFPLTCAGCERPVDCPPLLPLLTLSCTCLDSSSSAWVALTTSCTS